VSIEPNQIIDSHSTSLSIPVRDDSRRVNFVLLGRRRNLVIKEKDIIICAEGWPALAFCLAQVEEASCRAWVYSACIGDQHHMLKHTASSSHTVIDAWHELVAMLRTHINCCLVVEGSVAFAESVLKSVSFDTLPEAIVVVPYCRFRKGEFSPYSFKWCKVAHSAVGGATTSAWSMGVWRT